MLILSIFFFNHRDACTILSIPCNIGGSSDTCIWHPSNTGIYSVKTGYKVANEFLTSKDHLKIPGPWKKLWNCKVPPKVRVFLWRAVRGCLPNRFNLFKVFKSILVV